MAQTENEVRAPRERRPSFWDEWIDKRIVIQTKGRIVITGTFRGCGHNGFLRLEKPTIKGISVKVQPPVVMVDRAQIGHFHEECATERISNDGE